MAKTKTKKIRYTRAVPLIGALVPNEDKIANTIEDMADKGFSLTSRTEIQSPNSPDLLYTSLTFAKD